MEYGISVPEITTGNNRVGQLFWTVDMKKIAENLDLWTRRRIRMYYWKQWKRIKTKHDNLVKLGIDNYKAREYANTRKGYRRISNSPILAGTFTNKRLNTLGYFSFSERYEQVTNS